MIRRVVHKHRWTLLLTLALALALVLALTIGSVSATGGSPSLRMEIGAAGVQTTDERPVYFLSINADGAAGSAMEMFFTMLAFDHTVVEPVRPVSGQPYIPVTEDTTYPLADRGIAAAVECIISDGETDYNTAYEWHIVEPVHMISILLTRSPGAPLDADGSTELCRFYFAFQAGKDVSNVNASTFQFMTDESVLGQVINPNSENEYGAEIKLGSGPVNVLDPDAPPDAPEPGEPVPMDVAPSTGVGTGTPLNNLVGDDEGEPDPLSVTMVPDYLRGGLIITITDANPAYLVNNYTALLVYGEGGSESIESIIIENLKQGANHISLGGTNNITVDIEYTLMGVYAYSDGNQTEEPDYVKAFNYSAMPKATPIDPITPALALEGGAAGAGGSAVLKVSLNPMPPGGITAFSVTITPDVNYGTHFNTVTTNNVSVNADLFPGAEVDNRGNNAIKVTWSGPAAGTAENNTLFTISYPVQGTPAADDVNAVTVTAAAVSNSFIAADASRFTPGTGTANIGVLSYKRGDANMNGTIDAGDITAIINYMTTETGLSEVARAAADANQNGTIESGDITAIINYMTNESF